MPLDKHPVLACRVPLLPALSLGALLAVASPSVAQLPGLPAEEKPAAAESAPPEIAPEFVSPRSTYREFLARMIRDEKEAAAELLDLSELNVEAVAAKGPGLAYKLFVVLKTLVSPGKDEQGNPKPWPPSDTADFADVPEDPATPSPWSVSQLDTFQDKKAELIELTRDDDGRWRFSKATVRKIEELYTEAELEIERREQARAKKQKAGGSKLAVRDPFAAAENPEAKTTKTYQVWFSELFPTELRRKQFSWQLLPTYQWICLLAIAVIGRVAERLSRMVLTRTGDAVLKRIEPEFEDTTRKVWRPVGRLVNAAVWYEGAWLIDLPYEVVNILLVVLKLFATFAAVWAASAVIDLVGDYFSRRAKRRERKFDDTVLPLAKATAKIFAIAAGVVTAMALLLGTVPSALLGGLGIGGLAIALASQETLSNFFGSITVLFDRPFEVGDWVVVEGIEGEIERVGFRSTRIRTGLDSQVTLPNSKLAAASVDNMGRRKYRRYLTRIGVEYSTPPERIEAFCEGIRELIRRHPHTRKDFYAANFNEFGASALEILLVVYFEAPDWATELRERNRLLIDIVRLAKELGIAFAFPTQTVHLYQEKPPAPPTELTDAEREGQRLAAEIAGELPNYQDRPGKVKFTGPTPIDELRRE